MTDKENQKGKGDNAGLQPAKDKALVGSESGDVQDSDVQGENLSSQKSESENSKSENSVDHDDITAADEETVKGDESVKDNDGDVRQSVNEEDKKVVIKKSGKGIAWFALFIAMVALGLAGYLGWLTWQQQQVNKVTGDTSDTLQRQVRQFAKQQEQLETLLAENGTELSKQLSQRDAELGKLKESLVDVQLSIDAHARRLLSLTATTTDDWRLAEVEYLLRLANQRILTSKDGKTALNLLRACDQILVGLADPRLFKVRQAIATDRAALSIVGERDLDGIFLNLVALSNQIHQLPIIQAPSFEAQSIDDKKIVSDKAGLSNFPGLSGWLEKIQSIAYKTWLELKGLIIVQKRDTDIKPLLPPNQQFYLRNNLRLLLSQAQIALLDGRQKIYSESLTNAIIWLERYFPMEEPANQSVRNDLKSLQSVVITVEYPDVSQSLLAVRAHIAEQHRISMGDIKSKKVKVQQKVIKKTESSNKKLEESASKGTP